MKKRALKLAGILFAAAVIAGSFAPANASAAETTEETVQENLPAEEVDATQETLSIEETTDTEETSDTSDSAGMDTPEAVGVSAAAENRETTTSVNTAAGQADDRITEDMQKENPAVLEEAQASEKKASAQSTKANKKSKKKNKKAKKKKASKYYKNKAVVKLKKNAKLNVRSSASKKSAIIAYMEDGSVATVLSKSGKWYKIKSGNVTGYVRAPFMKVGDENAIKKVENRQAKVKKDVAVMRTKATASSKKVKALKKGAQMKVLSEAKDGWLKVSVNGKTGYVRADRVKVTKSYQRAQRILHAASASKVTKQATSSGENVTDFALQFVGNPYRHGGSSLTHGTDCSGFIMSVYAHYGLSLPHSSHSLRSVGKKVSRSGMKKGDILCYPGHVALYIGNGKIVHASTPSTGIKVSNAFYRKPLTIRRVIN